MILVLFLLHFCNFLPAATLYSGNRFPEANEFQGEKNTSNFNADRSEVGSELNANDVQEAVVQSEDPVKIETLPVGQGDATIVFCPDYGSWISLIDMGSTYFNNGAMDKANYLRYIAFLIDPNQGYTVKHVFLTHPDEDHLNYGYRKGNGLLPGLKAKYPAGAVTIHLSSLDNWDGLGYTSGSFMGQFILYLKANAGSGKHFNLNEYDRDIENENVIHICGTSKVTMTIVAADLGINPYLETTKKPANSMSMVLSLNYQGQNENIPGRKMLFMGDFQGIPQYLLLLKNEKYSQFLPSNVIMVPHHGSDTEGNANPLFYDLVGATHAIISSNIQDSNRHPRLNTLASICDGHGGYLMVDYEPYFPVALCDALHCVNNNMAQGHGAEKESPTNFYEDSATNHGCGRNIHQTTKLADGSMDGRMMAFKVVTKLYLNKDIEVVSEDWPPSP